MEAAESSEQRQHLLSRSARDSSEAFEMAELDEKTKSPPAYEEPQHATARESDEVSLRKGDLLQLEHVDPVLDAKMHLVNNAIDEIGMTTYQWKLFVLNGFG